MHIKSVTQTDYNTKKKESWFFIENESKTNALAQTPNTPYLYNSGSRHKNSNANPKSNSDGTSRVNGRNRVKVGNTDRVDSPRWLVCIRFGCSWLRARRERFPSWCPGSLPRPSVARHVKTTNWFNCSRSEYVQYLFTRFYIGKRFVLLWNSRPFFVVEFGEILYGGCLRHIGKLQKVQVPHVKPVSVKRRIINSMSIINYIPMTFVMNEQNA